ncbi:hypothetical protein [Nocardia ignorata]|uniref:Uncharacterized protein n=1 Tax=Nocardia ignorata TaxID=145285 RepID=A0A4R6PU64_NOCIG|nr:hypothetical protein [Nocardia ignorata]TDP42441.1 hypothetical protein DFR75_1011552 [Nocardia ignorata]
MHVTDSAVQLLWANPVVAAGAGYTARSGVTGLLRHRPYARVLGRFVAAFLWGSGGVAALTALGVPLGLTLPLALTVLTVVALTLTLVFAGGMIRPAPADSTD